MCDVADAVARVGKWSGNSAGHLHQDTMRSSEAAPAGELLIPPAS